MVFQKSGQKSLIGIWETVTPRDGFDKISLKTKISQILDYKLWPQWVSGPLLVIVFWQ